MGNKNKVIAGDYMGADVTLTNGKVILAISLGNMIILNKTTVKAYELKAQSRTYTVAVDFNDGKKCLLEMDEKLYKTLVADLL